MNTKSSSIERERERDKKKVKVIEVDNDNLKRNKIFLLSQKGKWQVKYGAEDLFKRGDNFGWTS